MRSRTRSALALAGALAACGPASVGGIQPGGTSGGASGGASGGVRDLGALTDEASLVAAATRGDRAALRRHAWALWAALSAPAGGAPAWQRFVRADRAFAPGAGAADDPQELRLKPPRRFDPDDDDTVAPGLSAVLFNQAAVRHLRDHALFDRAALGRAREQARAVAGPHAVPAFPRDAISLKAIWYPVHRRGLTVMPVWDGVAAHADAQANSPSSWPRVVAVDPDRVEVPAGEAVTVHLGDRRLKARVVPLTRFVTRALTTDAELASAREAAHDPTLARGDYVALVAMHVTTKEVPDWFWATLWWHDQPDLGPLGADRPPSIVGAARSYVMDTVVDPAAPCFNPWIEGRFADGLRSSCVSCHERAVALADDFLPVPQGRAPAGALDGELTVDFLWSIAFEAR
jgi:hypothetical protein